MLRLYRKYPSNLRNSHKNLGVMGYLTCNLCLTDTVRNLTHNIYIQKREKEKKERDVQISRESGREGGEDK